MLSPHHFINATLQCFEMCQYVDLNKTHCSVAKTEATNASRQLMLHRHSLKAENNIMVIMLQLATYLYKPT